MSVTHNNRRKIGLPRTRARFLLGSMVLVGLVIASAVFAFTHFNAGKPPPDTKHPSNESLIIKTTPVSRVTPALEPTATSKSKMEPKSYSSFRFTAGGDYGRTNNTTATLNYIGRSGASFNLALGDFSYDPTVSAAIWSMYAKSLLPTNFPFEIVPGDHDTSQVDAYAADLPDHIGNISGIYGKEYSFDYPPGAPLARFIMLSPGVVTTTNYAQGGADYNWVSQKIDSARAASIKWVILGMAEGCLFIYSAGYQPCGQPDLLNLLISKKVDLILQAHVHNYEASKQLSLNSATCPTISLSSYNANCVVNATASLIKGAGSEIVNIGVGGYSLLASQPTDPKAGYFRTWMRPYVNPAYGVSQFNVTGTQISMRFVPVSGGAFTDSLTISG